MESKEPLFMEEFRQDALQAAYDLERAEAEAETREEKKVDDDQVVEDVVETE